VLEVRSRRSRFSDKLVELITARFSLHDHERWGRVWWQRLGELAAKPGDKRAAVEPLLVGRPSDLAHEATRAQATTLPAEVDYVAGRDFRVVHFGGYTLAIVPVPRDLDLHLTARVARERFSAQLSVAYHEGAELVVLTGEEGVGRRGLDLSRMVSHLASEHEWIEVLSDEDHVARMRVRELPSRPERLDEVIGEIAMGRSIFEA
jgi:virulence-associated protein VagC